MELDFHHAVTYILARLAKFSKEEASIIAYSAQYVDDAVKDSTINFDTGELYKLLPSAHKMVDTKNLNNVENRSTWTAFHFLPGNNGLDYTQKNDNSFLSRIVCQPNSFLAKDMISECIRNRNSKNGLHRLGITMHVYADTWSHQGFIGIKCRENKMVFIEDSAAEIAWSDKVKDFFGDLFDRNISSFIDDFFPLGHATVMAHPDKPYLSWKYQNNLGEVIERENPVIFLDAVKNMYVALVQYKENNCVSADLVLPQDILNIFHKKIAEYCESDCVIRHQKWLNEVKAGTFGFVDENVSYDPQGNASWEVSAFGENYQAGKKYKYDERFAQSDIKKFNDALIDHHYYLTRVLYPRYGMCVR